MAHSDNIISSVKLPDGNTYEIHDPHAIHSAEELGLGAVMRFCGTVETFAELQALTDNQDGDVWHVKADGKEYVRCDSNTMWEFLGSVHDASSSDHTHNVTVTGTNSSSTVTGSVTIPTYTATKKYIGGELGDPTVTPTTDKVLGSSTTFTVSGGTASTTKLKATASGVTVSGNGTASAITGFADHATASMIQSLTKESILAVNSNDSVSIPNVTGTSSVTASKVTVNAAPTTNAVNATVTNGVLNLDAVTVVSSASSVSATDVSASKVTLGTAITASKITTASKSVVTGGTSKSVISALGTPTTADVLTGVKVTAQPTVTLSSGTTGDVSVATGVSAISVSASGDEVDALTGVSVSNPSYLKMRFDNNEFDGSQAVVSGVTVGSTSASLVGGTAAAQTWTQKSGTTGTPK